MNPMQAMINGMSHGWQKERAQSQMTLGALIEKLKKLPQDIQMTDLSGLDSYRGYYCDLAFEPSDKKRAVSDVLKECLDAMGKVFTGYKGGDFMMGENTPIWISPYGRSSGIKLMGVLDDGSIVTEEESD